MTDAIGDRLAVILPSGREMSLTAPDPSVITLQDIAAGLAHQWRWSGFGRRRLTVAEHCVLASTAALYRGLGWRVAQAALLHDAHEFVLRDLPPGLKNLLPGYPAVASRIQEACERALGAAPPTAEEREAVRRIDLALRLLEVRDGYAPACDLGSEGEITTAGLPAIIGFSPEVARAAFVEQFANVRRELAEI